jgi:outer membrane protein assembly factor BamB
VAYDAETGQPVWVSLDDRGAYTSAMVVTLAGVRQLVVVTGERIAGLRIDDGSLLWDYPWITHSDVNAAQPLVVDEHRLFVSAGYGHGAVLLEIVGQDGRYTARKVWETTRMKNKFNASVIHEGHVYGLDDGILACIDLDDGTLRWKGGRYGFGQVLLASGHLVIITERGELVLVKPSPEGHQELARFQAIEGKTWNNPAIAGGKLLVRNTREAACFRIAP